jgi:hypothetical protein
VQVAVQNVFGLEGEIERHCGEVDEVCVRPRLFYISSMAAEPLVQIWSLV